MSKPVTLPDWATTASGSDITAPSGGKQATGWVGDEFPPHNYFNWWMNLVGKWIDWLDAFESTAHTWSVAQIGLTVTASLTYPSLANGANVSGERKLCYWSDVSGAVHIEGLWDAGSGLDYTGKLAWAAATLPSGLRPTGDITQACFGTSAGGVQGLALVDVKMDGSLKIYRTNTGEGIDSIADPRYIRVQIVYQPTVAAAA